MIIKSQFNDQCITYSQMNLIFNSRIFWRRLTTWTRIYLISRYYGVGTEEELFGRMYLESSDFGDMLRLVFGRETSQQYTLLLNQYSIILRDLLSAQFSGDTQAVQQDVDRLYQNADQRADFLASINPYWDAAVWRGYLDTYLQFTLEEANSFVTGDYSNDIRIFDRLTALTNQIGDYFAEGLYRYLTAGSQNGFVGSPDGDSAADDEQALEQCFTFEEMNQIYAIRMFWFELASWIRAYMLRRYKNIGNSKEVYDRLKQVPVDYVRMIGTVFGEQAAQGYIDLFNTYIDLIDAYVTAQLNGNSEEVGRITRQLYQNADERAAFIASLNPFWTEEEWRSRLYNNLKATIEESSTLLSGDYARNIDIFSTLLSQAESASSYFAQGLISYINDQKNSVN